MYGMYYDPDLSDEEFEYWHGVARDRPTPTSCAPARPAKAIANEHRIAYLKKMIEKEMIEERTDQLRFLGCLP